VDIFINNASDSTTGVLGVSTVEEIQRSMISNVQTPVLIVEELVKRKCSSLRAELFTSLQCDQDSLGLNN
jgi:hypothetical protein